MNKQVSSAKKKTKQGKEKVRSSKQAEKTNLDTLGTWLDKQKNHGLEKGTFRSFTEGKMPPNTTQDWLSKQNVIEEDIVVAEVAMPTSTTEAWLNKRVAEMMSVDEKAAETVPQVAP